MCCLSLFRTRLERCARSRCCWSQRAQSCKATWHMAGTCMHACMHAKKKNLKKKIRETCFLRHLSKTNENTSVFPLTPCQFHVTKKGKYKCKKVESYLPSCTELQRVMRRRMLALVPMVWNGALLRLSPVLHNSVACRSAAVRAQVSRLRRSFISALPHEMLHPHVLPVRPQRATPKASRNCDTFQECLIPAASLRRRCHLLSEAARPPPHAVCLQRWREKKKFW